jgi:hypothetical protein
MFTKIKALWFFETLGTTNQTTQRHISEDLSHLKCRRENLKSRKVLKCILINRKRV